MSIIRFIEPMLLLQTDKLPEGAAWLHEVKLDGYRAIAGRSGNRILFRSRRDNDFTRKFPREDYGCKIRGPLNRIIPR